MGSHMTWREHSFHTPRQLDVTLSLSVPRQVYKLIELSSHACFDSSRFRQLLSTNHYRCSKSANCNTFLITITTTQYNLVQNLSLRLASTCNNNNFCSHFRASLIEHLRWTADFSSTSPRELPSYCRIKASARDDYCFCFALFCFLLLFCLLAALSSKPHWSLHVLR